MFVRARKPRSCAQNEGVSDPARDGHAKIANREFCATFALNRGRWHSPSPRPRVIRAPRADFIASPTGRETCQTDWRKEVNSNCRYRFSSLLTTAVSASIGRQWQADGYCLFTVFLLRARVPAPSRETVPPPPSALWQLRPYLRGYDLLAVEVGQRLAKKAEPNLDLTGLIETEKAYICRRP